MSHNTLPVDDRRITIIDPIPASQNNNNIVPTANCFMVKPGGAFCFNPYNYTIKGVAGGNTILRDWCGLSGTTFSTPIKSVKVLWQTLEDGDLGDPALGVVNKYAPQVPAEDDHTNIVELKNGDSLTDARIYCRVAPNTTGGSGLIAAYDGESTNSFNGTGDKGTSCFKFKGVGQQVDMPGIPTTDWDWLIYPQGLYDTLKRISATYPNLPVIYITENGLGHKDPEPDANGIVADPERIDFVDQHMEKVLQSRAEGVDVQGYFIWSLQDQFSWANGYNKRYGLFYIDFDTQKRYIKQSALWYKELADTMADAQ